MALLTYLASKPPRTFTYSSSVSMLSVIHLVRSCNESGSNSLKYADSAYKKLMKKRRSEKK